MNADQIVEYASRQGYRVVVTEAMVVAALTRRTSRFTCRDLVEALPRDDQGCTVSEYLVALWIEELERRGWLRQVGRRPCMYEACLPR